jgi:hypothetical protein
MGFPIQNNYSILRALAFGNGRRYHGQDDSISVEKNEYTAILQSLKSFNLFAFVIHDPEKHQEFHNNLNSIFERLDHSTGQNLLFFALTNPPERWRNRASQRDYYKQLSRFYNQQEGDLFGKPIITKDTAETAFTLANTLKIPSEMLPVIVVTNDFRNNDFRWFKTSEHYVEKQLNELGFLAYDCPEVKYNWQLAENFFNEYQDNFDLCNATEADKTLDSVAKALSDALSFMVIVNRNEDNQYNNALTQAKSAMQTLQSTLKRMKKINNSGRYAITDRDLFEQLNLNIANFLGILNAEKVNSLDDFLAIERLYLEDDTFQMLVTAKKVLDLFERKDWNVQRILGQDEKYDYTSVGICLTKLFEREINLSLVHWIRKELGIHLPVFFNKFDNTVYNASYVPNNIGLRNPRPIDFNKRKYSTDRWVAPGIGESKLCFSSMVSNPLYSSNLNLFSANEINNLIPRWEKIADLRNTCAHTELINRQVVEQIIRLLRELNNFGLFNKTYQLKQTYRQ